ncbi:hypothetical protein BDQ12DRAFT_737708 [Crucibulum laeve]|uniref:Uncharacterized protein n=1 Tax=Crucibulum laeve TaxID=68775 RepID=A0A5C3LTJ8_9AGAR|nr:hypothetical protein BDQ12DRAFT_737708 [Crucibulum laeve]
MRRLSLHASALNNAEYDLYSSSLDDIVADDERDTTADTAHDDAYYEQMVVGVREARAWLRGRYSHVPAATIDTILKYFSPTLGLTDTVTGGQFFAALRLVVHAESGKEVDRTLAFVQAHPASLPPSRPASPPKRQGELPPPMPQRRMTVESSALVSGSSITRASIMSDPSSSNPFSNNANADQQQPPPQHPSQRQEPSKSHNPFVKRQQLSSTRSDDGSSSRLPPLPPRKAAPPIPQHSQPLVPPPRHPRPHSQTRSKSPSKSPARPVLISSTSGPVPSPLPPPPNPKPKHITSNLIKQSLQASKAAQSLKRAEEQLEKERFMQVLKSSAVVSGAYSLAGARVRGSSVVIGTSISTAHRQRSPSPYKIGHSDTESSITSGSEEKAPPLPRRRATQRQVPSPPMSTSSLEQVALAGPAASFAPTSPPPMPTSSFPPGSSILAGSLFQLTSPFDPPAYHQGTSTPRPYHSQPNTANIFAQPSVGNPWRPLPEPPTTNESPHGSPSRRSVDLPSRGSLDLPSPPPTHPDRKPAPLGYHTPSNFESQRVNANLQSFEAIYGPRSTSPPPFSSSATSPFSPMTPSASSSFYPISTTPGTSVTPVTPTSADSPTARVFRSKSMHHPSPPLPPLPPPMRRKRPESVQVLGTGEVLFGGRPNLPSEGRATLSRHTSLSHNSSPGHRRSSLSQSITHSPSNQPVSSPHSQNYPHLHNHPQSQTHESPLNMVSIQRTLAGLQPKLESLQPKFDKARYKAEAGLSRRGFVREGHGRRAGDKEGLMDDELRRGDDNGVGMDDDSDGPGVDQDDDEDERWREDRERGRGRAFADQRERGGDDFWIRDHKAQGGVVQEKDNLKWPAGEGWAPL